MSEGPWPCTTVGGNVVPIASPVARNCVEQWAARRASIVAAIAELHVLVDATSETQRRIVGLGDAELRTELHLRAAKAVLHAQREAAAGLSSEPSPQYQSVRELRPAAGDHTPSPPPPAPAPAPAPAPTPAPAYITAVAAGYPSPFPSPSPPPASAVPTPAVSPRHGHASPAVSDSAPFPPQGSSPGHGGDILRVLDNFTDGGGGSAQAIAGGVVRSVAATLGGGSPPPQLPTGAACPDCPPWPVASRLLLFDTAVKAGGATAGVLQLRAHPSIFRAWKRRVAFIVGGALVIYRDGAGKRDSFAEHYILPHTTIAAASTTFGESFVLTLTRTGASATLAPTATALAFPTASECSRWERKLGKAARRATLAQELLLNQN